MNREERPVRKQQKQTEIRGCPGTAAAKTAENAFGTKSSLESLTFRDSLYRVDGISCIFYGRAGKTCSEQSI